MSKRDERTQLAIRLYIEFVSSVATKRDLDDGHDPEAVHEELAERAIMASETLFDTLARRSTNSNSSPRLAGTGMLVESVA